MIGKDGMGLFMFIVLLVFLLFLRWGILLGLSVELIHNVDSFLFRYHK